MNETNPSLDYRLYIYNLDPEQEGVLTPIQKAYLKRNYAFQNYLHTKMHTESEGCP